MKYVRLAQLATLLVAGFVGLLGGCDRNSGASSSEGILLVVSLADDQASQELNGRIDTLEFYIAYHVKGHEDFVLAVKDQRPSAVRDVSGRDLVAEPWRELVTRNDPNQDRIKVYVLALSGGLAVGWGQLHDPEEQAFMDGAIVEREVRIVSSDKVPIPFHVGETGCIFALDPTRPQPEGSDDNILARSPDDYDCDGYLKDVDCGDDDPEVNPDASEVCGNGKDDDCNGQTDEDVDKDNDGYTTCGSNGKAPDCDDNDKERHPGAPEKCNGKDDNCDGRCDEGFDKDGDGFNICGSWQGPYWDKSKCVTDEGLRNQLVDCYDDPNQKKTDPAGNLVDPKKVYPFAPERCNGFDDNCNGKCDEENTDPDPLLDPDRDGYTECGSWDNNSPHCELKDFWVDCAPGDPDIHPGAREECDGIDNDCDGVCDGTENPGDLFDPDEDGYTSCGTILTDSPQGAVCGLDPSYVDCAPERYWVNPDALAEICDGLDTDCNPNTEFLATATEGACADFDPQGLCRQETLLCDDRNTVTPISCDGQPGWLLPEGMCQTFWGICVAAYLQDPYSPMPTAPTTRNFDGDYRNVFDCTLADGYDLILAPATCEVRKRWNGSELVPCASPPRILLPSDATGLTSCPVTLIAENTPEWDVCFGVRDDGTMHWDCITSRTNLIDPCMNHTERHAVLFKPQRSMMRTSSRVYATLVWTIDNLHVAVQRLVVEVDWDDDDPDCTSELDPTSPGIGLKCDNPVEPPSSIVPHI